MFGKIACILSVPEEGAWDSMMLSSKVGEDRGVGDETCLVPHA